MALEKKRETEPTLASTQKKVRNLNQQDGRRSRLIPLQLALQVTIGKLADQLLDNSVGPFSPEIIGDLGYEILTFCDAQGINFEKCVEATIDKKNAPGK